MSKFGKAHLAKIHELQCGVCGAYGVEAHHILIGRTPGRKSSDVLAIPLCTDCHRGSENGIHGKGNMWRVMKKSELDILVDTFEKLYA